MADNRPHGHSSKSRRVGRPSLELNENDIFKLAEFGLTDKEMSALLEISLDTLNNFRSVIQKGRANLSKSIKRTQLEQALNEKNTVMLIWVGKQYCSQKDKQDIELSGEVSAPQVVVYGTAAAPWKNAQEESDEQ